MSARSKGGPLAVTDANLMLGRLLPDYFPKIFGKSEKEPLDVEASRAAFEKLARQINDESEHEREMELDEIVYGCVALGRVG
jgi:5-oxoprolinase (ATP-hydrolysing)